MINVLLYKVPERKVTKMIHAANTRDLCVVFLFLIFNKTHLVFNAIKTLRHMNATKLSPFWFLCKNHRYVFKFILFLLLIGVLFLS